MTKRQRQYILTRSTRDINLVPWYRVEDCYAGRFKRPVVLVNGCFDLLHSGHMKLFLAARDRAATLLVAMDSDDMVSRKKGPGRPILNWVERATTLQYLPIDGLVEIASDEEFIELVERLKPDFRVRGSDHKHTTSRVPEVPNLYVCGDGIRTSEIIRRCQQCKLD